MVLQQYLVTAWLMSGQIDGVHFPYCQCVCMCVCVCVECQCMCVFMLHNPSCTRRDQITAVSQPVYGPLLVPLTPRARVCVCVCCFGLLREAGADGQT